MIDLDQLEKEISQDAPKEMTLDDYKKRVSSYGKNSLKRPSRKLTPEESQALFSIAEGLDLSWRE
jgi:hypothetical protein